MAKEGIHSWPNRSSHRTVDLAGATEDESLDVTSTVTFDLDAHLAALDRACERKARGRAA